MFLPLLRNLHLHKKEKVQDWSVLSCMPGSATLRISIFVESSYSLTCLVRGPELIDCKDRDSSLTKLLGLFGGNDSIQHSSICNRTDCNAWMHWMAYLLVVPPYSYARLLVIQSNPSFRFSFQCWNKGIVDDFDVDALRSVVYVVQVISFLLSSLQWIRTTYTSKYT